MQEISLTAIIIGIIVGLLGVYFKEMMREAFTRKKVAIRLHAYIRDWYRTLFENEEFQKLASIGEEWYKDEIKALKSKENGAFEKVQEEYKSIIKEVEKRLNRKNSRDYKNFIESMKKLTHSEIEVQIEIINEQRKALIDNKFFVSEEDAANLSWIVASRVLNIKDKLMMFFININYLLTLISQPGTTNQKKVVQYFIPIFRALIDIAKNMKPLYDYTDKIKDRNVIYFLRP